MDPVTQTTSQTNSSSPPGYHKPTKRKSTKEADPFDNIPCPSDHHTAEDQEPSDISTFTKLVSAPLLFISFLLSLSYIDRQNRSYRVSQHSLRQSQPTLWSRLSLGLANWWDPEPYQDPRDGTWKARDGTGGSAEGVPSRREKWFARKKHRKMASMEVADAFDMVDRMKAVVAGVVLMGTVGVGWGVKKVWESLYW